MEYLIVGVVVALAVVVISRDALQRRRYLRARLDVPALLRTRIAEDPAVVGPPLVAPSPVTPPSTHELAGVWTEVEDALDPEAFRPKLAEGTEIRYFPLRWGDDYAMLAKADRSAHYELQVWEGQLVQTLDGTRTVGQVIVERLQGSGAFDAGSVIGLIESLRLAGVFDPAPVDVASLLKERVDVTTSGRRRLREFMRTLRISWSGADAWVRRLYDNGLHVLFRPSAIVVGILVSLSGLLAFLLTVLSGRYQIVVGNATLQTFIMMALGFVLTAAHEIGHASTLIHFRRKVLGAGFLLYYGSPAFFIDTSDGLMLDRGPRIMQALAGPFSESVLAGFSSLLLFALPNAAFAGFLYKFSVLNYYVIFLNLIPLLELDGYWVLADGIQVPDLRPRSIAFIRKEMWLKLIHREHFSLQEVALGAYGILGIGFTLLTSIAGLILWEKVFGGIVRELWDSGLFAQLLMIVLVVFFAGPAIRGLISLGRAIGRRLRAVWRRVRFKRETAWRVEAAELIDALPAFEDLPVDVLNDLAGRVQLRTYTLGETVFRMGDRPDAFYIVRTGRVAVEDVDVETGDTVVLRTLGRGESFGEMGLVTEARRQATIRATSRVVELFRVDENTFDRLLADQLEVPSFAPTMQAYAELRELPPFQRLSADALAELLDHGGWVIASPGEALVSEGEPGEAFYVIGSGRAEVRKGTATQAELGPGDHFGEIALLEDIPRTASVIAKSPLRAFRLDREGFDQLVASSFRNGRLRRASDRTSEH